MAFVRPNGLLSSMNSRVGRDRLEFGKHGQGTMLAAFIESAANTLGLDIEVKIKIFEGS